MSIKRSKLNGIKKGFSMIELIIVISVLGVLTAVVLNQAQGMRESSNVNRESSNLGMLSASVQSMFNSQGNYDSLSNNVIKASSSFPKAMLGASNNIKTVWADNGVTVSPESYNGQGDAAFSMTYAAVPEAACVDFVSNSYASFFKVEIGSAVIYNTDPAESARNYSIGDVVTQCSGGSTVTFYSR